MLNQPDTATFQNEVYEQLRQAIADARAQGDEKKLVSSLRKLGQAYMDAGDAPPALTELDEAIKIVSKGSDKETFSQLLGLRGLALKMIGNYSLALHAFRKSNGLATEINHPSLACDSLINIAAIHSEMGKVDQALSTLNDALKLASDNRDKVRKMRVYGLLGDYSLKKADPAGASEYYQMAQNISQDIGNRAAECSFIIKMGNVSLLEGKTEEAIEKYDRALKLASALEDRNAEINILGGLFRAHALAGEAKLAQVYGEQAIHLSAQIDHFEAEVTNIQALAVYLLGQGQMDSVFELLERGLQIVHEQTNIGWQMELLNLRGQAYTALGKHQEALESWNTALTLASNVQDEPFMAIIFGQMAAILAETGDLEKSTDCAENALHLALSFEDLKLAAQQQMLLAFNYADLSQQEKAIGYCNAAITSYSQIDDAEMAAKARSFLQTLEG